MITSAGGSPASEWSAANSGETRGASGRAGVPAGEGPVNQRLPPVGQKEAAAVGVYHPKWDERPILLIVRKPGAEVSEASIVDYLKDKIAKWWLPDEIVFVDELPHTATGKILKRQIRDDYKDYKLKSLAEA